VSDSSHDSDDGQFGKMAQEKQDQADAMEAQGADPTEEPEGEGQEPRPRAGWQGIGRRSACRLGISGTPGWEHYHTQHTVPSQPPPRRHHLEAMGAGWLSGADSACSR